MKYIPFYSKRWFKITVWTILVVFAGFVVKAQFRIAAQDRSAEPYPVLRAHTHQD